MAGTIRRIQRTDDFDKIEALYMQYIKQQHNNQGIDLNRNEFRVDYNWKLNFKDNFFPPKGRTEYVYIDEGYVYVEEKEIKAMMFTKTPKGSSNSYVHCGYLPGYEKSVIKLLTKIQKKQSNGVLYKFAEMLPGQIRSNEITTWEGMGFKVESYYTTWMINEKFTNWDTSFQIDPSIVHVRTTNQPFDISSMMEEDNEYYLATEFLEHFSKETPENIYLYLVDSSSQSIKGVAYYKVNKHEDGNIGTNTFGFHIRPHVKVSQNEVDHLIYSALLSMRQLKISYVGGRISSRYFDTILMLSQQGFNHSPMIQVSMTLSCGERST
ncbi:hypothetical protein Back11_54710 [Paenibacillus baekrokdamisoli]|uniref:Uncharacterized protein n=1 Tax=Paenibacillus baekrokdamisoli TaxID=1712516 RepID=A0A3G9J043_9BACL|nr:hypothetical protein [Paenibacillus baekrokdamisoli]MBB3071891.1 hypothetical protein [Paenibacillus baekrokdamisoli]BBH24126.1 hypothetical protein Back11_54710 [Paenibacillus baekrokdamisoli]